MQCPLKQPMQQTLVSFCDTKHTTLHMTLQPGATWESRSSIVTPQEKCWIRWCRPVIPLGRWRQGDCSRPACLNKQINNKIFKCNVLEHLAYQHLAKVLMGLFLLNQLKYMELTKCRLQKKKKMILQLGAQIKTFKHIRQKAILLRDGLSWHFHFIKLIFYFKFKDLFESSFNTLWLSSQ